MMMAVATMLCICKHNDNADADNGNGDDNLLQGGEQSSSVRNLNNVKVVFIEKEKKLFGQI